MSILHREIYIRQQTIIVISLENSINPWSQVLIFIGLPCTHRRYKKVTRCHCAKPCTLDPDQINKPADVIRLLTERKPGSM